MANAQDFIHLMENYDLDRQDRIKPGRDGIINILEPNKVIYGADAAGRVYVNLPIVIRFPDRSELKETMVIYQRYRNRDDMFEMTVSSDAINIYSILGLQLNDLTNIEKLLECQSLDLIGSATTNFARIKVRLDLPNLFTVLKNVWQSVFA